MWDKLRHKKSFDSRIAAALHYLYKAEPQILDEIKKMVEEHKILFTCHSAESEMVAQKCVEKHGISEIQLLEKHGLLNKNTILSHAIHVTDEDIEKIAKNQGRHFPSTSFQNHQKKGHFPLLEIPRSRSVPTAITWNRLCCF
jgi:5-methylthioadenosine/S-adenosylhomocysteine deaminase